MISSSTPRPFVDSLGLVFEETAAGESRCTLQVRGDHMNSAGMVHGAVLFALADTGMGVALYSTLDEQQLCATIEAKINYFKAVREGTIVCASTLVHRSKTIASLEAALSVSGQVVARGFGTFSVFPRPVAQAA